MQAALKQGVFSGRRSQARILQCKDLSNKEYSVQGALKDEIFSQRSSQGRSLLCKELSSKESSR